MLLRHECRDAGLVDFARAVEGEIRAEPPQVFHHAAADALGWQQVGLLFLGGSRGNPCVEAVDAGEDEDLKRLPPQHRVARGEGLADAAFHMLPTASGVLLPDAFAQSDDLMHFPHVEGVGAQQPEEFQAAKQLIDVVRRLRVLGVGIGIGLHRHKAVEIVRQANFDAQDLAALLCIATTESRKGGGFEGVGGHSLTRITM